MKTLLKSENSQVLFASGGRMLQAHFDGAVICLNAAVGQKHFRIAAAYSIRSPLCERERNIAMVTAALYIRWPACSRTTSTTFGWQCPTASIPGPASKSI